MELNRFYNCDCVEYMQAVPDNFFDLAVVDPPYGIGMGGGKIGGGVLAGNVEYKDYGDIAPSDKYFKALFRCSKNQIIWGGNYFADKLVASRCWLVWDKDNGKNNFADCELAWTSFGSSVRIFRFRWLGMLQGDMKNKEKRIHPNQKPIALYEWLLKNYAKHTDVILDTHVGSGSSLIACIKNSVKYVGCELDKDYYDAACKRMETYKGQDSFFTVWGC